MKKHASIYLASLISTTTAVVCIGIPWNLKAQDSAPAATATAPPAAAPVAAVSAPAPALPTGVSEVVKMYQGGIGKDVLISFVDNSFLPFHLNADGIIYLQHLGLPQEVTGAMIRRDGELQKQAVAQQQPMAEAPPNNVVVAGATAPPVVMPDSAAPVVSPYPAVAPAPAPVYPDYSVYPYYPYYGYPYYGPNVVIGGGWGWGWGGRGWGPGWGGRGGFHR
jgi:hypothetical protein